MDGGWKKRQNEEQKEWLSRVFAENCSVTQITKNRCTKKDWTSAKRSESMCVTDWHNSVNKTLKPSEIFYFPIGFKFVICFF